MAIILLCFKLGFFPETVAHKMMDVPEVQHYVNTVEQPIGQKCRDIYKVYMYIQLPKVKKRIAL